MNEVLLIIAIVIIVSVVIVLVWLISEYKKLKQQVTILSSEIERNNKDIAGLCTAAVSVDNRLIDSHDQLTEIVNKVTDFEQNEPQSVLVQPQPQSYDNAIQRVRNGASVEELTKQCGLSQDEAVLLIRLHSNK